MTWPGSHAWFRTPNEGSPPTHARLQQQQGRTRRVGRAAGLVVAGGAWTPVAGRRSPCICTACRGHCTAGSSRCAGSGWETSLCALLCVCAGVLCQCTGQCAVCVGQAGCVVQRAPCVRGCDASQALDTEVCRGVMQCSACTNMCARACWCVLTHNTQAGRAYSLSCHRGCTARASCR